MFQQSKAFINKCWLLGMAWLILLLLLLPMYGETAPVTLSIDKGDEAVYVGTQKMSSTVGKKTSYKVNSAIELTAVVLGEDKDGGWSVSHMWEATPRPKWDMFSSLAEALDNELQFARIDVKDTSYWQETAYPSDMGWTGGVLSTGPDAYLPSVPRVALKVGQKWDVDLALDRWSRARVKCVAASRGTVNGRQCVRIDLTSQNRLPTEAHETQIYEGAAAPRITLRALDGQIWVDEDDGWVVKYHLKYKQSAMHYRKPGGIEDIKGELSTTTESETTLELKSRRKVPAEELETLNKQVDRFHMIERLMYQAYHIDSAAVEGWRMSVHALVAMQKEYPKSPFILVLRQMEQKCRNELARAKADKKEPWVSSYIGQAAPDFEAADTNGKAFHLSDLNGKPVVLLLMSVRSDFPRQMAPLVKGLYEHWHAKGVEFIGCARDAKTLKSVTGVTFPVVEQSQSDVEAGRAIDDQLLMDGTLGAVAIDAKGIIRYQSDGFFPEELDNVLNKMTEETK